MTPRLFYISFASPTGFLGATVVEAVDETDALHTTKALGTNPGGEAAIWPVPPDLPKEFLDEMLSYKDRLVSKKELLAADAISSKAFTPELKEKFARDVSVFCEECNTTHKVGSH